MARLWSLAVICLCICVNVVKAQSTDVTYIYNTEAEYKFGKVWLITDQSSLRFNLKACSDAHLALAAAPTTARPTYEIILGTTGNSCYHIMKNGTGEANSCTGNFLTCDTSEPFWIEFNNGQISVGKGDRIGIMALLSWTDPSPRPVNAISFATANGQTGRWTFTKSAVRAVMATTPPVKEYKRIWVMSNGTKYISFRVRACKDATVALATEAEQESSIKYNIAIGSNNNQESYIRNVSTEVTSTQTPDILSCDGYRPFWISWQDGRIEVGRGLKLYDERILVFEASTDEKIGAVSIATDSGTTGSWELRSVLYNSWVLSTPFSDTSDYRKSYLYLPGKTSLSFRLKACHSALVEFRKDTSTSPNSVVYEFQIGSDKGTLTKLVIKDNSSIVHTEQADSQGVVDCYVHNHFWISWENRRIQIGRGPLYKNVIISYDDDMSRGVVVASFGIMDPDQVAEWEFPEDSGKVLTIYTPQKKDFGQAALSVPNRTWQVFKLHACLEATVLLGQFTGVTDTHAYEITFGASGNKKCVINRKFNGHSTEVASADTVAVLDCTTSKYYWVEWTNGDIAAGTGPFVRENGLVSYHDQTPYSVSTLSICTSDQSNGTWEFGETEGHLMTVITPGALLYHYAQFTTYRNAFTFSVKCCGSAHVRLNTEQERTGIGYAIALGVDNNQYSIIHTVNGTSGSSGLVSTPGILSCDVSRGFWITWSGSTIQMGRGQELQNELVTWTAPGLKTVVSVSVASNSSQPALWSIDKRIGRIATFWTSGNAQYDRLWLPAGDNNHFLFRVMSCQDVRVALTRMYRVLDHDAYEVVFGANRNRDHEIRRGIGGVVVGSYSRRNVLSCSYSEPLWIRWNSGVISMGRGTQVGSFSIVEYTDPDPYPIHALSITTGSSQGRWDLSEIEDDVLIIKSMNAQYGRMWMTTHTSYVEFQIRWCQEAHLALYANSAQEDTFPYEVVLGYNNNTKIQVRAPESGRVVAERTLPDHLSCTEMRRFWVSWKDDTIAVGRGNYPAQGLVEWRDTQELQLVNAISVKTVTTEPVMTGEWEFSRTLGEEFEVVTRKGRDFNQYWFTVTKKTTFVFEVKACKDVYLALGHTPGIIDTKTIVFTAGTQGNMQFEVISLVNNSTLRRKTSSHPILNCNQRRAFWLRRWKDMLEMGEGTNPGSLRALSFEQPDGYVLNAVSFATGPDNEGIFYFTQTRGNVYSVMARPEMGEYPIWAVPHRTLFHARFRVATCKDAKIVLTRGLMDTSNMYEFSLGENDNTMSYLKYVFNGTTTIKDQVSTVGILDCIKLHDFWYTTRYGVIKLGRNMPLGQRLLNLIVGASVHSMQVIALSSPSTNNSIWTLEERDMKTISFVTLGDRSYMHWVSVLANPYLVFNMKACGQVSLVLVSKMYNPNFNSYEIELGRADGQSVIREGVSGDVRASADTPSRLVQCDETQAAWIGWENGRIQVGRGGRFGKNRFLQWIPASIHQINAIGVTTGGGNRGYWEFPKFTEGYHRMSTRYNLPPSTWIETNETMKWFKVLACREVLVYVSSGVGVMNGTVFLITLGYERDSQSSIKDLGTGYTETSKSSNLDCDEYSDFWVSWDAEFVRVGTGQTGTRVIVTMPNRNRYNLKALGFATGYSHGDWYFQREPGEIVQQEGLELYNNWVSTVGGRSLVFSVKACREASLVLTPVYDYYVTNSIEIAIGINENSRTVIREGVDGVVMETIDTPDILSCNESRMFWISWDIAGSRVQLGRGEIVNLDQLISAVVSSMPPAINAVGTKSLPGVANIWTYLDGGPPASTTTVTTKLPVQPSSTLTTRPTGKTTRTTTGPPVINTRQPPAGSEPLSDGAKVGIAFGVIICVAIITVAVIVFWRRWKFANASDESPFAMENPMYDVAEEHQQ